MHRLWKQNCFSFPLNKRYPCLFRIAYSSESLPNCSIVTNFLVPVKKLELLSATPQAIFLCFSCYPNSRIHAFTQKRHAKHAIILNRVQKDRVAVLRSIHNDWCKCSILADRFGRLFNFLTMGSKRLAECKQVVSIPHTQDVCNIALEP